MKRNEPKFEVPPESAIGGYKALTLTDGRVVGWVCRYCSRLYEAPHGAECARPEAA